MVQIPFDNRYARLPERFHQRVDPTPVTAPALLKVNAALAEELGIDPAALSSAEGVDVLAGNGVPEGAEPLAMAYAGYQFGHWVPQLGDGRAILLGEVIDRHGHRRDIQLKGAGPTRFSRRGDGRAGLGPVLREYLVSEAMAALGVPTTRALAAVRTGEPVFRELPLPGAIVTRVASSHIRVGTFQFFDARDDTEAVQVLADHVIERHYPEVYDSENKYVALLDEVIGAQAKLVAHWLAIGFIHGVMNTDNCAVSGETIDYGPCAFMDTYHPSTVYSSIDRQGRYAFGNQPGIATWNLAGLAETLVPLFGDRGEAVAKERVETFQPLFEAELTGWYRRKLGFAVVRSSDLGLARDLLELMAKHRADFTLTFRGLCEASVSSADGDGAARSQFEDPKAFDEWAARWRDRLASEDSADEARQAAMRSVNPAFIPRNHLVEQALAAAHEDDLEPFETLHGVLARPYEDQPGRDRFTLGPQPDEVVHQTFCGT